MIWDRLQWFCQILDYQIIDDVVYEMLLNKFPYNAPIDLNKLFIIWKKQSWQSFLLSLAAPEIFKMTISGTASDNNNPSKWQHDFTLIPAWVSNYTNYKVQGEISYSFPNLNSVAVISITKCKSRCQVSWSC